MHKDHDRLNHLLLRLRVTADSVIDSLKSEGSGSDRIGRMVNSMLTTPDDLWHGVLNSMLRNKPTKHQIDVYMAVNVLVEVTKLLAEETRSEQESFVAHIDKLSRHADATGHVAQSRLAWAILRNESVFFMRFLLRAMRSRALVRKELAQHAAVC